MRMPPDADAVALTFDDGFVSFGDVAAPLLLDHGLPSTLFVVTDAVGKSNVWPDDRIRGVPELPLLDWERSAAAGGRRRDRRAHPHARERHAPRG